MALPYTKYLSVCASVCSPGSEVAEINQKPTEIHSLE